MVYFEYSTSIVNKVIEELQKAEEYIRIAMFQIHRDDVFDLLESKLKEGVKIEVFTLPYESIKIKNRNIVEQKYKKLIKLGASVHFCWWNVGSPGRTTTNVFGEAWFSFHGKFIVTEKSAITLSANFLDEEQLDALLIFGKNDKQIQAYNKNFYWLIEYFSDPVNKIKQLILNAKKYPKEKIMDLLKPEKKTNEKKLNDHWVRDYPGEICQEPSSIIDGLYLSPFDCRARSYLVKIIEESKFAFISAETVTDPEFANFLSYQSLCKDVKLLSSAKSADNQARTDKLHENLRAAGCDVRIPKVSIHGKLIITDKRVVVSSVNLNKINLGIRKTKKLERWRANTETITVISDKTVLSEAKKQYKSVFENSRSFVDLLVEKEKKIHGNLEIDGSTLDHIIKEKIEDDAKSYRKYLEKIRSHSEKI